MLAGGQKGERGYVKRCAPRAGDAPTSRHRGIRLLLGAFLLPWYWRRCGFSPPNPYPRRAQQDFAAVPIVREQPGDSVSWSFLGVAQGSCAIWGTGGVTGQVTHKTTPGRSLDGVVGGSWPVAGPESEPGCADASTAMSVPRGRGLLRPAARLRGVLVGWGQAVPCGSGCRGHWPRIYLQRWCPKAWPKDSCGRRR